MSEGTPQAVLLRYLGQRHLPVAKWAATVGFLLSFAGVLTGAVRALSTGPEVPCPSGAFSPVSEACYSHPYAFEGLALALVSGMLGAILAVACVVVSMALNSVREHA